MACGLPVITTKNTGASDLILPGENGEIVPIRNPEGIAEAVLKWWSLLRECRRLQDVQRTHELLSLNHLKNHHEPSGKDWFLTRGPTRLISSFDGETIRDPAFETRTVAHGLPVSGRGLVSFV